MKNYQNKNDWLQHCADENPDKIALQMANKYFTFDELNQSSMNAAAYFWRCGIRKDHRVFLIGSNSAHYVIALTALWKLGAVPVPINTRLLPKQIEEEFVFSKSSFIIFLDNEHAEFSEISDKQIITYSESNFDGSIPVVELPQSNTALVMFTSGTTSKPKGVIHSFENLFNSAQRFFEVSGKTENKSWLASLPFYHIGGLNIITRSLIGRSKLIIPKSLSQTDIEFSINNFRPSYISLVTTTLKRMLDKEYKFPPETEMVFLGGGPLDPQLSKKAVETGIHLYHVYGSTETCSMVIIAKEEDIKEYPAAAGRPMKNCDITILNSDGTKAKPGIYGDICIKTDSIFDAYLFDEKSYQSYFHGDFFKSGDLGTINENGLLFVDTRKDSIIISGGENINTVEIETAILKTGGIEDAVVIGIQDEKWGQTAAALIQPGKNVSISSELLISMLKKELPSFKIPKKIIFTNKIPRTELGKINREAAIKIITS